MSNVSEDKPRHSSEYFDITVPEEGYTPVVAVARAKAIIDMGLGFDKPWALGIIKGLLKGIDGRTALSSFAPRTEEQVLLDVIGKLRVIRRSTMEPDDHSYGFQDGAQACLNELHTMLTALDAAVPECAQSTISNAVQHGEANGKSAQDDYRLPRSVAGGDRPDEHGQGAGGENRGGTGDRQPGTGHGQAVGGDSPHAPSGRVHGADASHRQADDVLERQDGHSALRVKGGRLETFDPHHAPVSASTAPTKEEIDYLGRFINCSVFGPEPEDVARAHRIYSDMCAALSARQP